jgi:hypothetical protein
MRQSKVHYLAVVGTLVRMQLIRVLVVTDGPPTDPKGDISCSHHRSNHAFHGSLQYVHFIETTFTVIYNHSMKGQIIQQ